MRIPTFPRIRRWGWALLFALLALTTCVSCVHPGFRLAPETRLYNGFLMDSAIVTEAYQMFVGARPNEQGICLYGAPMDTVSRDGTRFRILHVDSIALAPKDSADPYHFWPPREPRSGCFAGSARHRLLGVAHDHPYTSPEEPCDLSEPDALFLAYDPRLLLELVFCSSGRGQALWADGRRVSFTWGN